MYDVVATLAILFAALAVKPTVVPRWTEYPVTPTLSVDAVQVSDMDPPVAVAASAVGAVGGVESAIVTPGETSEAALRLPAASIAMTR